MDTLLGYSDSEGSDTEAPPAPKPAAKPAPKPVFTKVVDRSNPGTIKITLPSAGKSKTGTDDNGADGPPAKKPRLGGGSAFGGFNSMLPAPKKTDASTGGAIAAGKKALGKGMGPGFSFKTSAEPAFSREPVDIPDYDEDGNPISKARAPEPEPQKKTFSLPPPKAVFKPEPTDIDAKQDGPPAKKPKKRFMPLSAARMQKQKKKPIVHKSALSEPNEPREAAAVPEAKSLPKPKVSLFGMPQEADNTSAKETASAHYEPLLYGGREEEETSEEAFESSYATPPLASSQSHTMPNAPASNGLENIATELNLSEADKRRLFGRKGKGADMTAANFIEFNTDKEYAHNEKVRLAGEQVQHNALKTITGTGKNNLRSLINVATTQKDALEDHFAQGRKNKKEAGNKYGW